MDEDDDGLLAGSGRLSNGHDRVRGPGSAASCSPQSRFARGALCKFIESTARYRRGPLVGQNVEPSTRADGLSSRRYLRQHERSRKLITRTGILSVGRKNGKTGIIAPILGGRGPEAKRNSMLYSAARSRDRRARVQLPRQVVATPQRLGWPRAITDSAKRLKGLALNTEYKALSADATTSFGVNPTLTIHDELGRIIGPTDRLYDALETFWWRPG